MTIRTRLTLWYAGMLLASLLLMGAVLHHELIGEFREHQRLENARHKLVKIMVSYGVPTMLVLVVGGSVLAYRALRPIATLSAFAEQVHAGNLKERIPLTHRGDELDRLAQVFNGMLSRVEAGVASVREFTLHASHELKTPLTILSAEMELALSRPGLAEGEQARLVSQLEEVRRLARLVETLSILAKADAGLPIVAKEPFRLDELLRDTVAQARLLGDPIGVTIDVAECDRLVLNGDRAGLHQVLLDLLGNAVKHNQAGGWIRIGLRGEPAVMILTVENGAELLPPELPPRIFERFVRGPRATDGFGLGLSITKMIVEAHGGTVAFDQAKDGVVRFTVCLPRTS
jgi:signal transduction histidine kinase